jgi:hypothetical protein
MYTHGTGSGHLSRINAVYSGFRRANIPVKFSMFAPRSKYRHLLFPGIRHVNTVSSLIDCDAFICDWGPDSFVDSLSHKAATKKFGLRRLGAIKRRFDASYKVFGIEPGVSCDQMIWPILSTYPDEVLSREQARALLNIIDDRPVVLLCENGSYAKHLRPVFEAPTLPNANVLRCSNAPYAMGQIDVSFNPIARLFKAADQLILGAGYNSVHEALSYADLSQVHFIDVGGDDQNKRLGSLSRWESGRHSRSGELAMAIARECRGGL